MAMIYVVAQAKGGYAREDADTPGCAGAYTDPKVAETVAKLCRGVVCPIEVDFVPLGYVEAAKVYGYKL